jgi:uncharacterized membrane protein
MNSHDGREHFVLKRSPQMSRAGPKVKNGPQNAYGGTNRTDQKGHGTVTRKDDAVVAYPYPGWVSLFCHHDPARSFSYKGRQFPLCARCTGLYPAVLVGVLLGAMASSAWDLDYFKALGLVIVFCIPAVLDGGTQYLGMRKSTNPLRFATGVLAGMGLGSGVGWIIVQLLAAGGWSL